MAARSLTTSRALGLTAPLAQGLLMLSGLPAAAQASEESWKLDVRSVIAVAAMDRDAPLTLEQGPLLGDLSLGLSRDDTFSNGLTLGWRFEVRAQQDARNRPAFAGVLGRCVPGVSSCPSLASAPGPAAPISPSTGISSAGVPFDQGPFVSVESASVDLSGPWGEGFAGYDVGVAARLDARAPSVLDRVGIVSAGQDPTGLSVVRARNDISGSSFKIGYLSPRWVGFRVGVSYAPEADVRGGDFDPRPEIPGAFGAELGNVWEGALSFNRRFRQPDLRVRFGLTATRAESGSRFTEFGTYEATGWGLELSKGAWTAGLRGLDSNNAWEAGGHGYAAWEAGLVHQGQRWRVGIEAGTAKDKLSRVEGNTFLVGAQRKLREGISLGAAYVWADADVPVAATAGFGHIDARNRGLTIELSVRN